MADRHRALEVAELLLALAIVAVIWRCSPGLKRLLVLLESSALRFYSRRKYLSMLLLSLSPAVARIAFLPIAPYPIPFVADEMSHLLLADTIASGRLTNPPHPLADHFEAIYVTQKRAYGSTYPPGHGLVMGAATAIGLHPWYGVVAETVWMFLAICWMLDAWFPPRWVIVGALIAMVRLSFWMVNYWGGALTAAGGALVIGALRRMWDRPRAGHGLAMGVGLAILANTRPYEAAFCGVATAISLVAIFRSRRDVPGWSIRPLLGPLTLALAVGATFTAYYDWRVTGNPLLVPNVEDQREHGTPTSIVLLPSPPQPPGLERFPDLLQNYRWQREAHDEARDVGKIWTVNSRKLLLFWHFYIHPLGALSLLALPFVMRKASMRWIVAVGAFVSAGTALYPFYFPHYSAPVAGLVIILLVQGLRHWSIGSRRFSAGCSPLAPVLAIAIAAVGGVLVLYTVRSHHASPDRLAELYPALSLARHRIEERLTASGTKHLVLVRYGPDHNHHWGATYNRADIDRAAVVFARELDAESNARLLRYYSRRTVWLFEADASPPRLTPFDPGSN